MGGSSEHGSADLNDALKSDGTATSTERVKDIAPDNTDALVSPAATIGGTLYFKAYSGTISARRFSA